MQSVYFNSDYFGYVGTVTDERGESSSYLNTFNFSGRRVTRSKVDMNYSKAVMLSNNEIAFIGDKRLLLYNLSGTAKFDGKLKSTAINVIPGSGTRRSEERRVGKECR